MSVSGSPKTVPLPLTTTLSTGWSAIADPAGIPAEARAGVPVASPDAGAASMARATSTGAAMREFFIYLSLWYMFHTI
ncbi:hypothetical protein ACTI_67930 [Actinoplanes sp. OR16]|nr:hypothetical protein ACTI_67930 [Actinoplanes sp. OR16]